MSPADKIAIATFLAVLAFGCLGEGIYSFIDRRNPRKKWRWK